LILVLIYLFLLSSSFRFLGQQSFAQNYVTYEKQSNFIKEFKIPTNERGLKGVTTDSEDNVWFYHATSNGSMIMKMSKDGANFTKYNILGNTIVDTAVINLAGGQLIFDNTSDAIWFTDARTNSLGKLDAKSNKIELFPIPTNSSGIMGLVFSPDRKLVWFTEITGNKIGSLDIESKKIIEYPSGDNSGPTLLTFDSKGVLWTTLSYANSILRVEPWLLIPGITSSGMYAISLEKPDLFSPFGITTIQVNGTEKIIVSDHGSSRVLVANLDSDLKNYTSYWTSPSQALPMSLPSQVVSDRDGNIFFLEHGGNKIVKLSFDTGIMTEYDIPTGPLATSIFLAVSKDDRQVWFTESESNKIAYLDNTVQMPLNMIVRNNKTISNHSDFTPIILNGGESFSVDVGLTLDENMSSLVLANDTNLSVVGMTDAGLKGVVYTSKPQTVNLMEDPKKDVDVDLKVETEKAIAGTYTLMIRASLPEKDNLTLSLLYPQLVRLDVPTKASDINKIQNFEQFSSKNNESSESPTYIDLIRIGAIAVVIILVGYLIYHRLVPKIKFKKT
ncbi:MAG: virginiamycin B lyase family protein, partial [Nitrososphaeraceae archaeon]